MKKSIYLFTILCFCISCSDNKPENTISLDKENASTQILNSIKNWNSAWKTKSVDLAIQDYDDKTDWTNAFGDRVQSKKELEELLTNIFAMDFVMEGEDSYINEEVEFLSDDIAILRSENIRTGQKWGDGSLMKERHIHHLRVYQKTGDKWLIISHMINQANERI